MANINTVHRRNKFAFLLTWHPLHLSMLSVDNTLGWKQISTEEVGLSQFCAPSRIRWILLSMRASFKISQNWRCQATNCDIIVKLVSCTREYYKKTRLAIILIPQKSNENVRGLSLRELKSNVQLLARMLEAFMHKFTCCNAVIQKWQFLWIGEFTNQTNAWTHTHSAQQLSFTLMHWAQFSKVFICFLEFYSSHIAFTTTYKRDKFNYY